MIAFKSETNYYPENPNTQPMTKTNNIPKDWKWVKLGEYVKSVKGKKPKRLSSVKTKECSIPYVNIKAFEKNIIDEYTDGVGCVLCDEGDFVMVWDGSRSGYVGKSISGALGSTLVKLDFPDIDNNYAYYFLQSKFMDINTRAKGVGIPHVDPNILWNYELLIPPLPVQQAIVSKIEELFSELDNGIAQLKTAQQQLKTYRQSVLKWAFEGKLTEEWRLVGMAGIEPTTSKNKKSRKSINPTNHGLDNKLNAEREGFDPPDLPEGWKITKLGECIEDISSGKSYRCDERPPKQDEVGIVKVSSVTWGFFDEMESKTCFSKDFFNKKYLIKKGDFLFSRANTIEFIGACVIVNKIDKTLMLSDKILRFTFSKEISKDFVLYYLRSRKGRKQIETLSTGNQDSMRNIGQEKIRQIKFPFCQLEEQHQIVQEIESRLSVADKMEESISASLQQAEALRQSILKRAFEGSLI